MASRMRADPLIKIHSENSKEHHIVLVQLSLFHHRNQKKRKGENTENTQMQCGKEAQRETIWLTENSSVPCDRSLKLSKLCQTVFNEQSTEDKIDDERFWPKRNAQGALCYNLLSIYRVRYCMGSYTGLLEDGYQLADVVQINQLI